MTEEMNKELIHEFREDEIRTALFLMAPLKFAGPNGFSASFYQSRWHDVGKDIIRASLNSSISLNSVNAIYIALIPKMKGPQKLIYFRSISLCNVLYKIISKVLANQLKMVLPLIISSTKGAFILDRHITCNILVAYETLHTMNTCLGGKVGYMVVKLDMSKAYMSRVEWEFLKATMVKMRFNMKWINVLHLFNTRFYLMENLN